MPPVLRPSTPWFVDQIRSMKMMIRKLAMQQSATYAKPGVTGTRPSTCTPGQNTPVVNLDQIPASAQTQSRRYGLQTLDPQGKQRLMVGEQSDGSHGLWVYSAKTGKAVLKTGELTSNATPDYGMIVEDPTGNTRVQLGELVDGDYGLSVTDPATSTTTQFLPVYEASVTSSSATTSTSYATLGGPSKAPTIGASGQALLTVNSLVGVTGVAGALSAGFVGVGIDGATPSGFLNELLYFSVSSPTGAAVGIAGNQSAQVVVSTLPPGEHTFKMLYKTAGGQTVNFRNRFLQVRPL